MFIEYKHMIRYCVDIFVLDFLILHQKVKVRLYKFILMKMKICLNKKNQLRY